MWLLVFNEIGFQSECFCLAVSHDEFDFADLTHHQADAWAQVMAAAKVASNPAAQGF